MSPANPSMPQQSIGRARVASLDHRFLQRVPSVLPLAIQKPIFTGAPVRGFISSELQTRGGANIFISDVENSVVYIYNTGGKLTGTLTNFQQPEGLAIDKAGSLYVADEDDSRVQVYAKGYNGAPTTLNDQGEFPFDVAIDANGNVAVANAATTEYGAGSISFFAKGATMPTSVVTGSFLVNAYFDTFDAKGNLYVTGIGLSGNSVVGEVVGGIRGAGIQSVSSGTNFMNLASGIEVTSKGLIAILDQAGRSIHTYMPPRNGSLGNPVSSTSLGGSSNPVTFALTHSDTALFTVDAVDATALEYVYPSGGLPTEIIHLPLGSQPIGVAINPPEIP